MITKAVIPVAGLGTRMLPATKAIPKEMLPIVDRPLIQYIVHECVEAGIKEIVFVTHNSKSAIENHFDNSIELEAILTRDNKTTLFDEIHNIVPDDVTIVSVFQGEAKGLGHAVSVAHPVVGDEPFAVLLPDVLIDEASCDLKCENLASMVNRFENTEASQIMVEPVPAEAVSSYGIVDCSGVELRPGESAKMARVVEKPSINAAPSNLAVVGRYVLSSTIWELLEKTQPGAGNEIQLTDAIDALMANEAVEAFHMTGKSHDCGSKIGYLQAVVEYGMRDKNIGASFTEYLRSTIG